MKYVKIDLILYTDFVRKQVVEIELHHLYSTTFS